MASGKASAKVPDQVPNFRIFFTDFSNLGSFPDRKE